MRPGSYLKFKDYLKNFIATDNQGSKVNKLVLFFLFSINRPKDVKLSLQNKASFFPSFLFPSYASRGPIKLSDKAVKLPILKYLSGLRELQGDYIAGLVQAAPAPFTATLKKNKESLNISTKFTLVQKKKYKDVILAILHKFNVGFVYYSDKDQSIIYQVNKLSELSDVIIPFFMNHQLRSGKLTSFLQFKYIVEVLSRGQINRQVLLSLMVIASNLNPLGKVGGKIRYLRALEQKLVINNIQPPSVDISKLTQVITNFKAKPLTVDFLQGLWDGDGGLSAYFKSIKKTPEGFICNMGFSFTIAQDIHNLSLLNEIKSYFNDRGEVFELSKQCNIYKSGKKSDLISVILPKILNKESLEGDFDNLFLPFMKGYKIYFTCKILELLKNSTLDKSTFHEVLRFSYHISRKSDNLTFKDYVKSSYDDLLR